MAEEKEIRMKLHNLADAARGVPIYPFWEVVVDGMTGVSVFVALTCAIVLRIDGGSLTGAEHMTIGILFVLTALLGIFQYVKHERKIWRFPKETHSKLVARAIFWHGKVLILADPSVHHFVPGVIAALKRMGIQCVDGYALGLKVEFGLLDSTDDELMGFLKKKEVRYFLRLRHVNGKKVGVFLQDMNGNALSDVEVVAVNKKVIQELLSGVTLDVKVSS